MTAIAARRDRHRCTRFGCQVNNSILGDGCVVRAGCTINHSVIGLRSLIGAGTTIEDALIMGCGTL